MDNDAPDADGSATAEISTATRAAHGQTGQLIPLPTLAIMAPIRSLDLSGSALHRVMFAGEQRTRWRSYASQDFPVHLGDGTSRAWAEHYAELFGAEHGRALSDLVHELPPVGRSEGGNHE